MIKRLLTPFICLFMATVVQADVLGEYSFEGTLGDKIPIRLKFCINGDEIAVGDGREYAYQFYNPRYGEMMGGTVKFQGAGKYKLHWEISNSPGNIAEGKSEPDRPAVLGEATHDSAVSVMASLSREYISR